MQENKTTVSKVDEIKDLDELWALQARAALALERDPRRLLQTRELVNAAGKMIDIVKCKLLAAELARKTPEFPQLGKYSGEDNTQKLLKA